MEEDMVGEGRAFQFNLLGMHLFSVLGLLQPGITETNTSTEVNLLFSVKRNTRWIFESTAPVRFQKVQIVLSQYSCPCNEDTGIDSSFSP